jgi:hypothetical protein
MASTRFGGKRCVYCGRAGASDTGDRVIAQGSACASNRDAQLCPGVWSYRLPQ